MSDEKNIFKVEINEKGAESIRRIYPLVKIIFWASLLFHLLMLYSVISFFIRYGSFRYITNWSSPYVLKALIYPTFVLLVSIGSFLYCYYFLRFSRRAKESLAANDSHSFNESLSWINKGLLFAITTVVLCIAQVLIMLLRRV